VYENRPTRPERVPAKQQVVLNSIPPIGTVNSVKSGQLIAQARCRAGLSLRELAARAGTSHSAIAAYEQGRTSPTLATLDRILTAAGFAIDVTISPRRGRDETDRTARGRELIEVLELAAMFPATHDPTLMFPRFGAAA
jgi:transcriptional regulator with XRE-family HTH domain